MSSSEDGVFLLSPATDGGVYQLINSSNNVNTTPQPAPTHTQIIRQTTPDGGVKIVKRVIKIVNVKPNQNSQQGLVGATVRPGGPNITVPQVRVVPQNQNYTVVSSVQQPVVSQGVPSGTLATVKEPGKNIVRILVKPKPKTSVPQQAIAPGQSLLRTVRATGTPIVVSQPTASIVIPKPNAPLVYARPPTPIVVSRPQARTQYIVTNSNGSPVVKPVSSVLNPLSQQNKTEELELVDSLVDDSSLEEDFEIAPPKQEIKFPKYRVVKVNPPVVTKQVTQVTPKPAQVTQIAPKLKVEELPVPENEVKETPKEQAEKVEENTESTLEKDTELPESSLESLRKELDDSSEDLVDNTEIPEKDIEKDTKTESKIQDITFEVSVQKEAPKASDSSQKKDKVSEKSSGKLNSSQKDSSKKEKVKKATPEKDFRKPAVSTDHKC